jgi:hypothetical protein
MLDVEVSRARIHKGAHQGGSRRRIVLLEHLRFPHDPVKEAFFLGIAFFSARPRVWRSAFEDLRAVELRVGGCGPKTLVGGLAEQQVGIEQPPHDIRQPMAREQNRIVRRVAQRD